MLCSLIIGPHFRRVYFLVSPFHFHIMLKRIIPEHVEEQPTATKAPKVGDGPKRKPLMLSLPQTISSGMLSVASDPGEDPIEESVEDQPDPQIELEIRHGDITKPGPDIHWVAHQANCTTTGARGTAAAIFQRWPGANVYRMGKHAQRVPGTITTMRFAGEQVGIIHCFAQNGIRRAGLLEDGGPAQRVVWMKECLDHVDDMIPHGDTIAFPYGVGCGLGGCDWETDYAPMFREWIRDTGRRIVFYKI